MYSKSKLILVILKILVIFSKANVTKYTECPILTCECPVCGIAYVVSHLCYIPWAVSYTQSYDSCRPLIWSLNYC